MLRESIEKALFEPLIFIFPMSGNGTPGQLTLYIWHKELLDYYGSNQSNLKILNSAWPEFDKHIGVPNIETALDLIGFLLRDADARRSFATYAIHTGLAQKARIPNDVFVHLISGNLYQRPSVVVSYVPAAAQGPTMYQTITSSMFSALECSITKYHAANEVAAIETFRDHWKNIDTPDIVPRFDSMEKLILWTSATAERCLLGVLIFHTVLRPSDWPLRFRTVPDAEDLGIRSFLSYATKDLAFAMALHRVWKEEYDTPLMTTAAGIEITPDKFAFNLSFLGSKEQKTLWPLIWNRNLVFPCDRNTIATFKFFLSAREPRLVLDCTK